MTTTHSLISEFRQEFFLRFQFWQKMMKGTIFWLWGSCLFVIFLPCFGSSSSSSTFEPILVESCVDSEAGDCHAGKANCNLRAAVELCIEIAPPICTIFLPYGVHHVNFGPMNITTNSSTRISITSSNSVSDPCYNFRIGDAERAVIDGSGQPSRLLNVLEGAYIELSEVDVSNFGHVNLDKGGAVLTQGGFVALDVNFYGNQAKLGAVAFNGEFGSMFDDDQAAEWRRSDDGPGRITDTQSALYVQHCSCDTDNNAVSNTSSSIDIYSASGQAYLDCSPSCTIEGFVKSSTTCVPTAVPSSMPSISAIPTPLVHDDLSQIDDDGDDDGSDDFFSDIAGSGLLSASSIAILLGIILCLLLSCMLGGNKYARPCKPHHRRGSSVTSSSHEPHWSKDDNNFNSNINSSILESMYKHFGVDDRRTSFVEKSPISEPFLQAALDSMEGRPGDWIIDVRALELGPMIGVGSSAHVFSAAYFGQRVAAKRLPAMTWRPEEVETFLRHEAGLLVHLHHPSVIKFYGVGISGDYVYMVTELCCGSLTNLIDRANSQPGVEQAARAAAQAFLTMRIPDSGVDFSEVDFSSCSSEHEAAAEAAAVAAAMPLSLLLSLALGIAQGVEFLHSRGVVHRDLKPDNVLLTESNEVKLCDFGISRMEHDRSGMTTAVGTPLLMAPELVLSETASQVASSANAVDVFSFGILLWMMSTQHLCPYDGVENPWLLLSQVTQGRRPPLQVSASSEGVKLRGTNLMKLPDSFRELIARCWDQDPMARPPFSVIAEQIANLLEHVGGNDQFV